MRLPISFGIIYLLFLCSCATGNQARSRLPADMSMNKDAGRGNYLFVTISLEDGEKLPFIVDTGSPVTLFDKSLEEKLGKCLGTATFWNFGTKHEIGIYAAPKLYLGHTPLLITGTNIGTLDFKQVSFDTGRPVMGILGMNVLHNYCIQLDFVANKIRFFDDQHSDKNNWGKPFPLLNMGDGCFAISENLVGVEDLSYSTIDTGFIFDGWLMPKLFRQWTNQATLHMEGDTLLANGALGGEIYPDIGLGGISAKRLLTNDPTAGFDGIGLHFLSRHLVTLDFPNHTMYLKRISVGPFVDKDMIAAAKSKAKSAANFLKSLKKKGLQPGWSKNDKGTAEFESDLSSETVNLRLQKNNDSSVYHYIISRASKNSPWKLQKAWRTDATGKTLEEYPVP